MSSSQFQLIFDILYNVVAVPFGWMESLYDSVGLPISTIIIGSIIISALYKFVLSPYLSGGSDTASNSKKKGDED